MGVYLFKLFVLSLQEPDSTDFKLLLKRWKAQQAAAAKKEAGLYRCAPACNCCALSGQAGAQLGQGPRLRAAAV